MRRRIGLPAVLFVAETDAADAAPSVTAGNDNPLLNATVELFAAAVAGKGEVVPIHHPTGQHAFDILADDATSAGIMPRRSTTLPSTRSRPEAQPRTAPGVGSGRMAT